MKAAAGGHVLLVDLAQATYFDSVALECFVVMKKIMHEHGGVLASLDQAYADIGRGFTNVSELVRQCEEARKEASRLREYLECIKTRLWKKR